MIKRFPRKLKKQVPKGMYCYVFTGKTSLVIKDGIEVTAYETKCCPKYFRNSLGYGDCRVFSPPYNGENDDLDFALDDQCKACGVNYGSFKLSRHKWNNHSKNKKSILRLFYIAS